MDENTHPEGAGDALRPDSASEPAKMDAGSPGYFPPEEQPRTPKPPHPSPPLITLDSHDPVVHQYIKDKCAARLVVLGDELFELYQHPYDDPERQRHVEWGLLAMIEFYELIHGD